MFFVCCKLGLEEYDPDGKKAKALEDAIGIKVIRHSKFGFTLQDYFANYCDMILNLLGYLGYNI